MDVVLVALNALPAIDPAVPGPIGGIETRAWLFARGLAREPKVHVAVVVRSPQEPPRTEYDGVGVITLVDPMYPVWQSIGQSLSRRPRFPWVSLRRWDWRLVWQLPLAVIDRLRRGRAYSSDRADTRLSALRPDVYVTFGVQTHSATVIRSAREAGRPCVLFLGSDGDLDPLFEAGGSGRDPYGTEAATGRFILQSADAVIVQTEHQQELLRERFGRESTLIRNPIDVAAWDAGMQRPADPTVIGGWERYVLWVGRAEDLHKRPQLCLELARRCPAVRFLMILNPRDAAVEARIRREAPSNVRIVPRVPAEQMPSLFARAAAFLSTSQLEGFPNVFLQAALSGVPIVSLEVGAEFLRESGAGTNCDGDLETACQALDALWSTSARDSSRIAHVRSYVIARHALAEQSHRLLAALRRVAAMQDRRSPE